VFMSGRAPNLGRWGTQRLGGLAPNLWAAGDPSSRRSLEIMNAQWVIGPSVFTLGQRAKGYPTVTGGVVVDKNYLKCLFGWPTSLRIRLDTVCDSSRTSPIYIDYVGNNIEDQRH
jgi:hypothetical protein